MSYYEQHQGGSRSCRLAQLLSQFWERDQGSQDDTAQFLSLSLSICNNGIYNKSCQLSFCKGEMMQ